jgi:hypothetical protein
MQIFDDYTRHDTGAGNKKEQVDSILEFVNKLHADGKIKDIMVITRTTDTEPAPKGLPQNVINALTVDTEYEATVFMRFATDMLFDRMKHIAIAGFVKGITSSGGE